MSKTIINRVTTIQSKLVRMKYWKEKQVPILRVSGEWLKEAGFEIGSKVSIEINNKQLIITNK